MRKPNIANHDPRPDRVRELLDAAGISQQEAARVLGFSPRSVRRWVQRAGTPGAAAIPYAAQYCLEALARR